MKYGSRWTPRGYPVIYTAASLSLAALELLVHMEPDTMPEDLVAIEASFPDDLAMEHVEIETLPDHWTADPAPDQLAAVGARWVQAARAAILSVPSAVIPSERNYIINPLHADFVRVDVKRPSPFRFDSRLVRQ
jgi:RES domain-containing protein